MPKFNNDIIGKTIIQHCGMSATCIAYRGTQDIDIKFDDGTIIEHRTKKDFVKGQIKHPNLNPSTCLNEKVKMSNGQMATCIRYRKAIDIDIQFEDGTIVKTSKDCFLRGEVKNPNYYIGLTLKMKNGQMATIIRHGGYNDVDIQFEDGTIVEHKVLSKFKSGSIYNPNCNSFTKSSCEGLTIYQKCGMNATCIKYRSNRDIDVLFEDGTIVEHRQKNSFLLGNIKNPNYDQYSCLNETRTMKNGQSAKCVAYRKTSDLDVEFEDGTLIEHRTKGEFYSGGIDNPNYNRHSCKGESKKMNNGQMATCIEYRSSDDIDIQFEDGTIVEHRTKESFSEGYATNPNFNQYSCEGETRRMNNGQMATCIEYRKSDDIDIQFEDGTIVTGRTKALFLKGIVDNPNYDQYSCLNEKRMMNCGMNAMCIAYRNSDDIDIQFEDGNIIRNVSKSRFYSGNIRNPGILTASLPQEIIYYVFKNRFKKVHKDYRPFWLVNRDTNSRFEIDIYIEDNECGIEYDGYPWHAKETPRSYNKFEAIKACSNIKKIYTILEKDCVVHESIKHINYQLSCQSKDKIQYEQLLKELEAFINDILLSMGVSDKVQITDDFIDEVTSKKLAKPLKEKQFEQRTIKQNCGMNATIIAYRRSTDIDVRFEDGTISEHKKWDSFLNGNIAHPNDRYASVKNRSSCKGETRLMNCGMNARCIEYRKADDIDIQFDDGTVVCHKSKEKFYKGNIANPNIKLSDYNKAYLKIKKESSIEGITVRQENGLMAKCIRYGGYDDIDIQFEDGTMVYHKKKSDFINGKIKTKKC